MYLWEEAMADKIEKLEKLAQAIRQKNAADIEIARIIDRPAERSHAGEHIAACIFDISLQQSASHKGIDGYFISGNLARKTVNIKWYGKLEGLLDINPGALPDFYLVMTGPKAAAVSSRGTIRPWVISYVFLFDAVKLVRKLESRGLKIGIATSVKEELWQEAEIYPANRSNQLVITEEQRGLLGLFT